MRALDAFARERTPERPGPGPLPDTLLRALDRLWQESPELRGRFTMLVVATPSRTELTAYQNLQTEVLAAVREINERYGSSDWDPIVLIHENIHAELLAAI